MSLLNWSKLSSPSAFSFSQNTASSETFLASVRREPLHYNNYLLKHFTDCKISQSTNPVIKEIKE